MRKAIQEPLKNSPDANPYFILELLEQFLPKYPRIPNKIGSAISSNYNNRSVYIADDPFDAAKSIILKELICREEQEYNPSEPNSHYRIIQELISNS